MDETLFLYSLQMFTNLIDGNIYSLELDKTQLQNVIRLVKTYIFSYLELNTNVSQLNESLSYVNYGDDLFDSNSIERGVCENLQRIFSKYVTELTEPFKEYENTTVQNQNQHLYSLLWVIQAMIHADSFYANEVVY